MSGTLSLGSTQQCSSHTHSPNTGGKTIGEETFCFDSSYGIGAPFLQGHFSALFCLYVMHRKRERERETRPHSVAISNSVSTEIMLVHVRVETSMLCFLILNAVTLLANQYNVIKKKYSCCSREKKARKKVYGGSNYILHFRYIFLVKHTHFSSVYFQLNFELHQENRNK